jgi:hypothetical protein
MQPINSIGGKNKRPLLCSQQVKDNGIADLGAASASQPPKALTICDQAFLGFVGVQDKVNSEFFI